MLHFWFYNFFYNFRKFFEIFVNFRKFFVNFVFVVLHSFLVLQVRSGTVLGSVYKIKIKVKRNGTKLKIQNNNLTPLLRSPTHPQYLQFGAVALRHSSTNTRNW